MSLTNQSAPYEGAHPSDRTITPTGDFNALRFAGYAALFDKVDAGGDIIRKGAFARSLAAHRTTADAIPLLWQHRPQQRIGWIERIEEDQRGLRVVARLDDAAGLPARMLADGRLSGLSFGYRARSSRAADLPDGRQGRELVEVDLFEVSLVTRPMQHGSRVHLVA